jgi:ABC-type transporter Mla subunit MlaD
VHQLVLERVSARQLVGDAFGGEARRLPLALLTPFAEETDDVLEVLRQQSGATRRFIRDTGVVFDSLTARRGQLRELIVNSKRTPWPRRRWHTRGWGSLRRHRTP